MEEQKSENFHVQLLRGKGLEIQRQREEASILISRFLMETCKAKLQSCLLLVSVQSWAIKMLYSFLLLAPKGILLLSLFVKVCITKGSWRSNAFVFFRIRKASLNVAKAVRKVPHSSSLCVSVERREKGPEIGSSPPSKVSWKTLMKRMKETAIKKSQSTRLRPWIHYGSICV